MDGAQLLSGRQKEAVFKGTVGRSEAGRFVLICFGIAGFTNVSISNGVRNARKIFQGNCCTSKKRRDLLLPIHAAGDSFRRGVDHLQSS
jgi:hypothetical protein